MVGILQYSDCVRDMNDISKYLPPYSIKGGGNMSNIGPSTKNNYMSMIFAFQLGTDFLHSCRMNYMRKFETIITYLMKNGVNLCPPWRIKIK